MTELELAELLADAAPTPWTAHPDVDNAPIRDAEGHAIAFVVWPDDDPDLVQLKANARLLASAPALLAERTAAEAQAKALACKLERAEAALREALTIAEWAVDASVAEGVRQHGDRRLGVECREAGLLVLAPLRALAPAPERAPTPSLRALLGEAVQDHDSETPKCACRWVTRARAALASPPPASPKDGGGPGALRALAAQAERCWLDHGNDCEECGHDSFQECVEALMKQLRAIASSPPPTPAAGHNEPE